MKTMETIDTTMSKIITVVAIVPLSGIKRCRNSLTPMVVRMTRIGPCFDTIQLLTFQREGGWQGYRRTEICLSCVYVQVSNQKSQAFFPPFYLKIGNLCGVGVPDICLFSCLVLWVLNLYH